MCTRIRESLDQHRASNEKRCESRNTLYFDDLFRFRCRNIFYYAHIERFGRKHRHYALFVHGNQPSSRHDATTNSFRQSHQSNWRRWVFKEKERKLQKNIYRNCVLFWIAGGVFLVEQFGLLYLEVVQVCCLSDGGGVAFSWRGFSLIFFNRSRNVYLRITDGRKYCYYSCYAWTCTIIMGALAVFAHYTMDYPQVKTHKENEQERIGMGEKDF